MCVYICVYIYNYTIRYYHPGKIIINIAMENHGCLAMEIFSRSFPRHHRGLVGDKSKTAVGVQGPRGLIFQDHLVPRTEKSWEKDGKNDEIYGESGDESGEIWRFSENQLVLVHHF